MYWVDQGTNKIQRANLDGTGVEDLLTSNKLKYDPTKPLVEKQYALVRQELASKLGSDDWITTKRKRKCTLVAKCSLCLDGR